MDALAWRSGHLATDDTGLLRDAWRLT